MKNLPPNIMVIKCSKTPLLRTIAKVENIYYPLDGIRKHYSAKTHKRRKSKEFLLFGAAFVLWAIANLEEEAEKIYVALLIASQGEEYKKGPSVLLCCALGVLED